MENPKKIDTEEEKQTPIQDVKENAVLEAQDLIRPRKEIDIDYAAEAVKFIIVCEDYRRASRKIFSRLGTDLRDRSEKKLDEVNKRLGLGIGRRKEKLDLKDALEMLEFAGDREKMKAMFQALLRQAHRVAEMRKSIAGDQRVFRDTNDAILRTFMSSSKEIGNALNNEPMREVKIMFPIEPELYREVVSDEEYKNGKDMPPTDKTILEVIDFVENEAKNVPADFLELESKEEKK